MEKQKESRRVLMTKRLLKESLLDMLKDKNISDVNITELCKRADVNRSTFYSYYDTVNDILNEIGEDLIAQLPTMKAENQFFQIEESVITEFTQFMHYIRIHAEEFEILLRPDNKYFREKLMETIMHHFKKNLPENDTNSFHLLGYIFSINGAIALFIEWIKSGFKISDKDFAIFVLKMCFRVNDF